MASVQFFLSQASGTEYLSNSNIVSSSPDKEKLVLSRRLQQRSWSKPVTITSFTTIFTSSLHTFLHQTYLWFQGFQHKLIFGFKAFHHLPSPYLSFLTHYWGINSCFWSSLEIFRYHPTIRFFQQAFSCFPSSRLSYRYCSSPRFSSCQLFSATYITTDVWLMKNIMPLSSLHSHMYHLYPSVIYWFLLRWKAQTESAFCSVLIQCLAQWSPAHVPDIAYGMVTANMITHVVCMYHVMYGNTVQI